MRKLFEQVSQLVIKLQMIADNLEEYNPGLCKEKAPLSAIQYDLACLGRELTYLFVEIGRRIKDETI